MDSNQVQVLDNLTPLQKVFAEKYVLHLNIDESVRQAWQIVGGGGSRENPHTTGHGLINNPNVQRYIKSLREQQQDAMGASRDRVLLELCRIAFVDINDMYDEDGCIKNIKDMPEDVRRAVAGIETKEMFEQDGKKKKYVGDQKRVKLVEKTKALEMLAKYVGLFQADNMQKQDVTVVLGSGEETKDIWDQLQSEY